MGQNCSATGKYCEVFVGFSVKMPQRCTENLIKFRKGVESKTKNIILTVWGPVVFPCLDYCTKFDDLIST